MQTLTKPWNKAPAGTEITDDPAEAKKGGKKVVLVDSARLAHLSKHGFFRVRKEAAEHPEAPLQPAPEEKPAVDLSALAREGKNVVDPRLDVVSDRDQHAPRPDSGPKGDR